MSVEANQARTPHSRIVGVDEAGRGPLAGPLVVAAVILDPAQPIAGLADSKQLSARRREALFGLIQIHAIATHVEIVGPDVIDALNILHATLDAMARCVNAIHPQATHALIDGNKLPPILPCPATAIVRGDALEPAISAASIIAKVTRDRIMLDLHALHPEYGFNRHKGYPTPQHLAALRKHGPCPLHRRSFAPLSLMAL